MITLWLVWCSFYYHVLFYFLSTLYGTAVLVIYHIRRKIVRKLWEITGIIIRNDSLIFRKCLSLQIRVVPVLLVNDIFWFQFCYLKVPFLILQMPFVVKCKVPCCWKTSLNYWNLLYSVQHGLISVGQVWRYFVAGILKSKSHVLLPSRFAHPTPRPPSPPLPHPNRDKPAHTHDKIFHRHSWARKETSFALPLFNFHMT